MNTFNYPENSITENNYDEILTHLNQTNPEIIQGLQLQTCDIQVFLSQVNMTFAYFKAVVNSSIIDNLFSLTDERVNGWNVYSFRAWREQVWPSSCSQKPSSRCPFHLSGLSSSSSCSSASVSRLCLAASREWWSLCRTSESCPELGPKKFSVVNFLNFLLNTKHLLYVRIRKFDLAIRA